MIHNPQIHRNTNRLPNDDPRTHHEVQNRPNIALPAGTSSCRHPGILIVARHPESDVQKVQSQRLFGFVELSNLVEKVNEAIFSDIT